MTAAATEAELEGCLTPNGIAPKYSKWSERIRNKTAGAYQCRLFCRGRNCKYEVAERWPKKDQAIDGLFSHWVTSGILATSRPNSDAIKAHDIIGQFSRTGIKSIVNLQEPNEHAYCGPPLDDSGFSYDPQVFMDADIFFYNFGWKDYGVPTMTCVFNMVKVVDFALQEGKVAVHCHAGLGRTGVVIACYLIYAHRIKADKAIAFVRSKRPRAIQTRAQMQIVRDFADHIGPMWKIFPRSLKSDERFSLAEHLRRQQAILHGLEARQYKHLPKIIDLLCRRVVALIKEKVGISDDDDDDLPNSVMQSAQSKSSLLSILQENDGGSKSSLRSSSSPSPSSSPLLRRTSSSSSRRRSFFRQSVICTSIDENAELDVYESNERLLGARQSMTPRSLSPNRRLLSVSEGNLTVVPPPPPLRPRRTSSPPPVMPSRLGSYFRTRSLPVAMPVNELFPQLRSAYPSRAERASSVGSLPSFSRKQRVKSPRFSRTKDSSVLELLAGRSIVALREAVGDASMTTTASGGDSVRRALELEEMVNRSCSWEFLNEERELEVLVTMLARWLKYLSVATLSGECVSRMAEEMGHADDECLSVLSKAQKFVLVSLARVLILFESARKETREALHWELANLLMTVYPRYSIPTSPNLSASRRSLFRRVGRVPSTPEVEDLYILQPAENCSSAIIETLAGVLRHLVVTKCHKKTKAKTDT